MRLRAVALITTQNLAQVYLAIAFSLCWQSVKIMGLEERLDKEFELIENDESLTDEEKRKEIRELYRESREIEREQEERWNNFYCC